MSCMFRVASLHFPLLYVVIFLCRRVYFHLHLLFKISSSTLHIDHHQKNSPKRFPPKYSPNKYPKEIPGTTYNFYFLFYYYRKQETRVTTIFCISLDTARVTTTINLFFIQLHVTLDERVV